MHQDDKKAIRRVLVMARGFILGGWTQGAYSDRDSDNSPTCFCAMGALIEAGGKLGLPCTPSVLEVVTPRIRKIVGTDNPFTALIGWNDSKGRTKRQVLGAFDRAIARVS